MTIYIAGVIPYLPYCKQSKMRKRGCITAKLLASMLAKAGMSHLLTIDLYHKEIQGFFDFPVDNLRASPFLIQYIKDQVCVNLAASFPGFPLAFISPAVEKLRPQAR